MLTDIYEARQDADEQRRHFCCLHIRRPCESVCVNTQRSSDRTTDVAPVVNSYRWSSGWPIVNDVIRSPLRLKRPDDDHVTPWEKQALGGGGVGLYSGALVGLFCC